MEKRWKSMNYKRLLNNLMEKRNINPDVLAKQMRPEIDKREYNEMKQVTLAENLSKVDEEYEKLKISLMPPEKTIVQREEMLREKIKDFKPLMDDYSKVETEAKKVLEQYNLPRVPCFSEVLIKGRQRREIIGRTLGANTEHYESYERKKMARRMGRSRQLSAT
jgi:hypothetical protein